MILMVSVLSLVETSPISFIRESEWDFENSRLLANVMMVQLWLTPPVIGDANGLVRVSQILVNLIRSLI